MSTLYGKVLHSEEKSATCGDLVQPSTPEPVVSMLHGRHAVCKFEGSVFAQRSTWRLVAKSEEQNRDAIPTPRFAKRPPARNSNSPRAGVYSQNQVVHPRLQVSELHFDKFPTPSTFSRWKIRFTTQVSARSGSSSEAMLWIKEVDMVDSVDDLKLSQSIAGQTHWPNFELLDARIASSLNKIIEKFQLQEEGQFGGTKRLRKKTVFSAENRSLA